jgi:CubicO group peptidase (beta-lactamase class C family)
VSLWGTSPFIRRNIDVRNIKIASVILLAILLISCAPAASTQVEKDDAFSSQIVEALQSRLGRLYKKSGIPGMAVVVVDDEKILWKAVYGHTARDKARAVDPETIFSIQSISKNFTSLGILMAVQDGLLDLDEPITTYLPDFKVNSPFEEYPEKKMTLRILLTHRAGFTHEAPVGGNYDSRPHTFEEHILSISDTWLRYPVGYKRSYSNLGIDLAGYILQEKTGVPFWDYIEKKILDPLGMSSSTLDPEEIEKRTNRAVGYFSPESEVPGGIPVDVPMIPAGGVYTNILDMAEFMKFHINQGLVDGKQLLNKELLDEMYTIQFPEKKEMSGSGFAIYKSLVSQTFLFLGSGGGYGFISSMTICPELKIGIATLTNSEHSRINGRTVQQVIVPMIRKKFGPTQVLPRDFDETGLAPISPEDERVKRIMGVYERNLRIGYKGKTFGVTQGRAFYPLEMFTGEEGLIGKFGENNEFRIKPDLMGRPGTIVGLNRTTGSCDYYDFQCPDESMDEKGPDKPEWQKYLGVYNTLLWGRLGGRTIRVEVGNGYLTVNGTRCHEYLSGLFFQYNGETLDFRGTIPSYRNIALIKRE